ncbi:dihydroorotase-like cyclic amidohydrolase [Streptomyces zagrosensis]|uniref:Dihydroorotase-like cyclic amidohydrolase n=1 Tax=Streptomyces zagrosensis TaxID=1042984 RepID=A0A7W9Q9P5_9ACTN|nr:dihydroorotase-like cyclic amidohydrolase [Streptomyces zagrosensis]
MHILHLSSSVALPLIADARRDGVRIIVETCPHFLTLTVEEVPDGATEFTCCPPIREAANQDTLWQGLQEGTIDCVVSDRSPCTAELKTDDFGTAWGGISSLQLGLPAIWTAARVRGRELADVARWMSTAPAALAGLAGKGAIAPGLDADFVVLAPEETFTVGPAALHHRNRVTAYAGKTLHGVVRSTWLRGVQIADAGRPTPRAACWYAPERARRGAGARGPAPTWRPTGRARRERPRRCARRPDRTRPGWSAPRARGPPRS